VDDIDRYVGKRLREKRKYLGLSQQDLGEHIDVSIQQIQKYEKASNRISSGNLYKLAKKLEVPLNYFFEGIERNPSSNVQHLAEDQKAFSYNDQHEREISTLIKYYNEISDPTVRKKIIDLVKAMATTKVQHEELEH
jgi:transcriptional regulator with XRE-family HTH domain